MSRFDYVAYDPESRSHQMYFKIRFEALANAAEAILTSPRAKALVLTKLEEAYAWVGKAIRDDQLATRGAELQEGRGHE